MNPKALHKLSYGMYVVSSKKDGRFNGQIANTAIQVTSNPVTILVSINRENLTYEYIRSSGVFTVSVIGKDASPVLIGTFGFKSGRAIDKFSEKGIEYRLGSLGVPIVTTGTLAYLEAKVIDSLDVGTHTVFFGEVVEADILREGEPMTYAYYHEIKRGLTPSKAATYIAPEEKPPASLREKPAKYKCTVCGYIYDPELGDPEHGIKPGTSFEDLPDSWTCPICGASKLDFERMG